MTAMEKRARSYPAATLIAVLVLSNISASFAAGDALLAKTPMKVPWCGSLYAPPFASQADGEKKRICEPPVARAYSPVHHIIGPEALDLESKACFVPDAVYRLLDDIIDTVTAEVGPISTSLDHDRQRALILKVGQNTGQVSRAERLRVSQRIEKG
jgi:hypothetical protein